MEDLQKLVASPRVTETEFPSTFLKALSTSGVETKYYNYYYFEIADIYFVSYLFPRLKNCVFHLMRSKGLEKWILEQHSGRVREPLVYVAKVIKNKLTYHIYQMSRCIGIFGQHQSK